MLPSAMRIICGLNYLRLAMVATTAAALTWQDEGDSVPNCVEAMIVASPMQDEKKEENESEEPTTPLVPTKTVGLTHYSFSTPAAPGAEPSMDEVLQAMLKTHT